VDSANASYSSADGVLFNKSQTTLIQYPGGKIGSYTIPASVTTIGDWAFYGSWQLTSVTIPSSVTNIGNGAFGVCTSLISVYFTGNAPSIGSDVFSGTDNTTVYYLPGTTGWGETFAGRPTALWIIIGPVIQANGSTNDISINSGSTLSITVRLYPGNYAGVAVDWWIVAQAGSSWYYLNDSMRWTSFDGNLSNCHPMYMGGLINLPETQVLSYTGLPVGSYTFWFAVDYPMDGVLDVNGTILADSVNVTVQ